MRIVLIIVVALLTLATAAFVVDPTSGPVATQFVSTYFMPPITWVVSKTGFNVASHGLYLIIGLGIAAFILINSVFNRVSAVEGERDHARAQLSKASEAALHEHLANMSFEQRLALIEDQSSVLERELSRLENADEADDAWRDRIESIGETIKEIEVRQGDHAAAAKFSGVIDEIENYVNGSTERLKRAVEATSPEHINELGGAVAVVGDKLNDLREQTEPLKRFLESARDIDRQITQFVQGEGGVNAMLRDAERLRDRLRTRLDELSSDGRESIESRMSSLASDIARLERSFDELDLDSRRERLNGLDKRLEGLHAQLTVHVPFKAAAE